MTTAAGLEVAPIIGLEVHVQLATRTKMFCACEVVYGALPNSGCCPVCLGLPGSLPVINERAVELAIRTALALNCRIADFTKWDRKGYYYPDLPKNYQISQYDLPLAIEGKFSFPTGDADKEVRIRRAHLEEDSGKNIHDFPGYSGVDLNRAGTPLLEIVTEPDFHSAEEVRDFAVQLQRLVAYLGVSEGVMQKGQMRFEPNINVKIRRDDIEYRTPIVEVKNLNSFKSVYGAITFEISRQTEQWLETGATAATGNKSNRGWDDVNEVTLPQREKEEANDYRYFPDPDLVPLKIARDLVERLRADLPELPVPRTVRFIAEYGFEPKDAPAMVDDRATADLLDAAAIHAKDKRVLGKHFLGFWAAHANAKQISIVALGIAPDTMAELANLVSDGTINATAAAQISEAMLSSPDRPAMLAERLGLLQTRDTAQIDAWVMAAIEANPKAVQDAVENPKKIQAARGFLTGQVMKLSGGRADPKIIGERIEKRLSEMISQ